ncbi:MAG: thiamine phosphate synthase [Planctomyces sp.]|nr:thiamine phosphate synthase [Planctomyces sp.]MBA4119627.1 thiamine phosphate synthase [Isosphaera sp.]
MDPILRMLDANINRAREALRVLEDIARFALDDGRLVALIKPVRQSVSRLAEAIPGGEPRLLAARNTPGDAGAGITTRAESARAGPRDIASAAAKRLTEALRVIEECAKATSAGPRLAQVAKEARYAAYEAERAILSALPPPRGTPWRLCVLLTESLCAGPWLGVARAAIEGGADCIQLREKALPDAELLRRALALVELARAAPAQRRASVVINDRPDIALASGADGVHLGQDDLPLPSARALAGDRLSIGVSTHTPDELRRAVADGADVVGIGAMFASTTKDRPASGPQLLRWWLGQSQAQRVPHLAIGGVTPANAPELARLGCRGVAVSAVVCAAADPAGVCRALLGALGPAPGSGEGPAT